MTRENILYERTPLGQAIYNIYKKHGFKPSFFKNARKRGPINLEIYMEWKRLERVEKGKRRAKKWGKPYKFAA